MVKGYVTVDQARCKGCNLCVTVCPVKILELDQQTVNAKGYNPATVINDDKCIGCGSCALICPDSCFTVEKEVTNG